MQLVRKVDMIVLGVYGQSYLRKGEGKNETDKINCNKYDDVVI